MCPPNSLTFHGIIDQSCGHRGTTFAIRSLGMCCHGVYTSSPIILSRSLQTEPYLTERGSVKLDVHDMISVSRTRLILCLLRARMKHGNGTEDTDTDSTSKNMKEIHHEHFRRRPRFACTSATLPRSPYLGQLVASRHGRRSIVRSRRPARLHQNP